jgi:hypothetical protein
MCSLACSCWRRRVCCESSRLPSLVSLVSPTALWNSCLRSSPRQTCGMRMRDGVLSKCKSDTGCPWLERPSSQETGICGCARGRTKALAIPWETRTSCTTFATPTQARGRSVMLMNIRVVGRSFPLCSGGHEARLKTCCSCT